MLPGKNGTLGGNAANPRVNESAAQMQQDTFNVTPKNIVIGNLDGLNTLKKQEISKQDEEEDEEELKIPILFNNFEGFKDVDKKKQESAQALGAQPAPIMNHAKNSRGPGHKTAGVSGPVAT